MRVTTGELAAAAPCRPPGADRSWRAAMADFPQDFGPRRFNRLAIAAFVTALAGIPLFGVFTGLVATILGSIALGTIRQTRQRGVGLALVGVFLGIADVVGWVIFLSLVLVAADGGLATQRFRARPGRMENLPPHINRALRANVLIETHTAGSAPASARASFSASATDRR